MLQLPQATHAPEMQDIGGANVGSKAKEQDRLHKAFAAREACIDLREKSRPLTQSKYFSLELGVLFRMNGVAIANFLVAARRVSGRVL